MQRPDAIRYFLAHYEDFERIMATVNVNRQQAALLEKANALLEQIEAKRREQSEVRFYAVNRSDMRQNRIICRCKENVLQLLLDGEREDSVIQLLGLWDKHDARFEFIDVNPHPKHIKRPDWDLRLLQEFPTR